jgi:beta-phosphoglucomutase
VRPRAVCFDLNGTVSHDEELYFEAFAELFAREGRPLTREEYFDQLVGRTDVDCVRLWLGEGFVRRDELLEERRRLFLERASDGRTVPEEARRAVRAAAAAVPVAVVTGAFRVEAEAILGGAGLSGLVSAVVAFEDAERPKPDPEPYLLAARLLGVLPPEAVAFEDTAVGVAAAKAAGLRCVAVLGTQPSERLAAADELVFALDAALVGRLLA